MNEDVSRYQVAVRDEDRHGLRDRLQPTRWPEREEVDDWSQGTRLADDRIFEVMEAQDVK